MTDAQPAADPTTLDALRREVASATGAARAGVDVADDGTGHTARQIVYAISRGAAEDPDFRTLLRELATESERLSGEAVRLQSRYLETERAMSTAAESGDRDALVEARGPLEVLHVDGVRLRDEADAIRRRLPRTYGDPLELDRDWPAAPDERGPDVVVSEEDDWWDAQLRATVTAALNVDEPDRRAVALRELLELIEEAQGPATLAGGLNTILGHAYEVGCDDGRYGGQAQPTPPVPVPSRAHEHAGSADGDAWMADYFRTKILAALKSEETAPSRARQIAELVAEAPVDKTAQDALITALASAHEVGRRDGVGSGQ